VFDGEVVSHSFQDLMRQVHRKSNVQAEDARLALFDMIPVVEFRQGASVMKQRQRRRLLEEFAGVFAETAVIELVSQREFDLDSLVDEIEFRDYNRQTVEQGYEGIMIKSLDAPYECKRSSFWMKWKPTISVDLNIVGFEEGTGRNAGRLGAIVCEGEDNGRRIRVNVGSGISDSDRDQYWVRRDLLLDHLVEVQADAVTQNKDGTYSLRFPRFLRFRDFEAGEKV
jgi:DNA ligase-1